MLDESLKRKPFWMVWSPQGRAPAFKHSSESSAVAEAKRLARQCPEQDFYVLKAVSGWTRPPLPVQQLDLDPTFIPF